MAGAVRKNLGVKEKNASTDRANLIKKLQAYYMKRRKKHGAGKVSLRFSMKSGTGYAGKYKYKKGKKPAVITIQIPAAAAWAKAENASRGSPRIRKTTTLAQGKKIINAELAHHVETLERAGHPSNTKIKIGPFTIGGRDAHGPRYKTAVNKVGPMPGGVPRRSKLKTHGSKTIPAYSRRRLGKNRDMSGKA